MSPRTRSWGALTRDEIAAARDAGAFAVLPMGSVEQHGGHLPVDTDLMSVEAVALLAAERCVGAVALVLPALAFGVAPEHAAWAGTISLSAGTLRAVVAEVVASLRQTGFERVLLVNGHGGNREALAGAGVPVVDYWAPGQAGWSAAMPGGKATMGHACAYETSLQLALRPGERARIAGRSAGLPPILSAPGCIDGRRPMHFGLSDAGYYGDPAPASIEAGAVLLECTVDALARYYEAFAAG